MAEDAHHVLEPLRRRAAEISPHPPVICTGELGAKAAPAGATVAARTVIGTSEARHHGELAPPVPAATEE
jgi:hypothetical protein